MLVTLSSAFWRLGCGGFVEMLDSVFGENDY